MQEAITEGTLSSPERVLRRRSRALRRTLIGIFPVLFLLLLLWYTGVFGGNVRAVMPGRVYRSAELTGQNLESVLKAYGIRTVISLRGGSPQDDWYRSETASCARLGIRHVDIFLSAVHMPPPQQLQNLLTAFDQSAYPVLFHCKGGADRSGLAGTLYLNLYQHIPLDEAEAGQLTWRYGHLSWGQAHAMDDFFTLYRQTSGGLNLRDWINTRYPALYAALPSQEKTQPPTQPAPQAAPSHPAPAPRHTAGRALSQAR